MYFPSFFFWRHFFIFEINFARKDKKQKRLCAAKTKAKGAAIKVPWDLASGCLDFTVRFRDRVGVVVCKCGLGCTLAVVISTVDWACPEKTLQSEKLSSKGTNFYAPHGA